MSVDTDFAPFKVGEFAKRIELWQGPRGYALYHAGGMQSQWFDSEQELRDAWRCKRVFWK